MRLQQRLVLSVLLPLWLAVPSVALGQEPAAQQDDGRDGTESSEDIDDPKVARRLGVRVDLAPAMPAGADAPAAAAASDVVTPLAPATGEPAPTLVEPATPVPGPTLTPRLKLGYRRFIFEQLAAKGASGPGADEPFSVLSIDLYPISSVWRFGLTAQYGWQEGTFRENGDAFFAGLTSLGWQIPGPVITPFFEGFAGGGLMQRTKKDLGLNTIATAFGQFGVDLGAEVFLARHFCLSLAMGWIHLANGYARQAFESISADTWSFKLGVAL
jgi:hypothetical protein